MQIGITLSVGFILQITAVRFKPAKPDLSGMPIFSSAEAGAGLLDPESFRTCFPKKVVGFKFNILYIKDSSLHSE